MGGASPPVLASPPPRRRRTHVAGIAARHSRRHRCCPGRLPVFPSGSCAAGCARPARVRAPPPPSPPRRRVHARPEPFVLVPGSSGGVQRRARGAGEREHERDGAPPGAPLARHVRARARLTCKQGDALALALLRRRRDRGGSARRRPPRLPSRRRCVSVGQGDLAGRYTGLVECLHRQGTVRPPGHDAREGDPRPDRHVRSQIGAIEPSVALYCIYI
mmetsp:Transcript_31414/g.78862  ORF Transcript_31414/g.78862 Transcript_31414/m.78862 type:complete len:218 (+) Transcript_31414:1777-2430(+)